MVQRSVCTLLALLLILPWTPPAAAQSAAKGVTLEQIMAHPDWLGAPPENPYWSDDGRSVYYERKRKGEDRRDLYRLDVESGLSTKVEPAQLGAADAPGGDLSRDRRWKVYAREGDIFLKDLGTGALRQITRTAEEEREPLFLAGDQQVGFLRDHQPFVFTLASGLIFQAADIRLEKDPAEKEDPGYLEAQQERLFDIIRERQEKEKKNREQDEAEQKADPTRPPLPFYLGEDVAIAGSAFSPAGDWMVLVTAPKKGDEKEKGTTMARFVTRTGNIEAADVRTKVGEGPDAHQVLLLDLQKHEKHEIGFAKLPGFDKDPLKELREKAKAAKAAKAAKDKKDEDIKDRKDGKDKKDKDKKDEKDEVAVTRSAEVLEIHWSQDGRYAGLVILALDNKDRWIATLEREKPELAVRHRLTDPAWINFDFNELGWIPESHEMYFLSEESGYSQLYLAAMKDGKVRRVVNGSYEVSIPVPSRDGSHLYYVANASHPGVQEAWRLDVKSGKAEQLTELGGQLTPLVSPDESRLLLLRSAINRHDEIYVQENRAGAEARQVTQTHSAEFLAQEWAMPEIVPIPSTHVKAPIYSRVYTPKGFDPARKYPAVVFTHGAGYLQNAHAGWSNYFREFMFHTLLTERGYVVLDMDYRASAGYGRDWRTAIYRQMGHPEVEDLEDGVAWLVKNKSVDPRRVGTYGGSYGGFLTFMSLFRKPELFAAGAALRPVTDWAHYNHEYTSNILNTPEVDPEAFEKSSPIEFAAGLNKPLLICTGMEDDNVFFQDSVRLVQRLIELKKENFETAIYPVESHAFQQPTSWLDEYRRILKLFETHLK